MFNPPEADSMLDVQPVSRPQLNSPQPYLLAFNSPQKKLHPAEAKLQQFDIVCFQLFEECRFG
jgi:hypothetical protein